MQQSTTWRLVFYVAAWYAFTLIYNIMNKHLLNIFPFPVTSAFVQLLCGFPFIFPVWFHSPPDLDCITRRPLMVMSLCHGLGSIASVVGVAAGSVAFSQAIRGAEPIFCAILSVLILKTQHSSVLYASLGIIVVGICMVSLQEFDFSWISFLSASMCGLLFQMRSVVAKSQLSADKDKPLTSSLSGAQLFRLITIVSCLQVLPIALLTEGYALTWHLSKISFSQGSILISHLLASGAAFYIYNEVAFWILELMSPVSHAITNALKRVVIIVISNIMFHTPMTYVAMLGVLITTVGTAVYSSFA